MTTIRITQTPDGIFSVSLRSNNSATFAELIEELKFRIPSRSRRYDPVEKAWRIFSRSSLDSWLDYVSDCADVRIIWDNDEAESSARQQAPPPRRPGRMVRTDAFTALHLLPSAPQEVVRAAHKALALLHHPDRGGDAETMKTVNAAFDLLKGAF